MHARVAAASTPHTPTISTTKEPPSQLQCRRYIVLSHQSGQRWVWEEPDPACGRSWGQNPLWATATGRARERVVTGLSSRALARIAALNTECARAARRRPLDLPGVLPFEYRKRHHGNGDTPRVCGRCDGGTTPGRSMGRRSCGSRTLRIESCYSWECCRL